LTIDAGDLRGISKKAIVLFLCGSNCLIDNR
jgi:hypothetical protein